MLNVLISSKRDTLSSLLFTKIKEDLDSKKQVVLVVPAQSTMTVEKKAFSLLEKPGFFDLHIIRGQKLAQIIQDETRRPASPAIDKIGREMLLKSIAKENEARFKTFGAISGDSSFLSLVSEFIVQVKQNGYNSTVLDDLKSKSQSPILNDKLSDMKIFFQNYEDLMMGKFTDSEDLVLFTADNAKKSPFVQNSVIYYYGFYSFTSREIYLLSQLEKSCSGLNIALLCGNEPHFEVTKKTLKKIQKEISSANLITADTSPAPLTALPKEKVHIVSCASPYSQALTIATDIKRKVREEKLSYSDIAVLTGNSPEMSESIKRVFKEADIPLFNDEKRTVLHSGAIEALSSSLAIAVDNYKTADALRFIKSGALDFEQDDIEHFENYLKLYHIKESKFAKPFKYGKEKLGQEVFERLEEMRKIFYGFTVKFTDNFEKANTVLGKSLVLYKYLAEDLKLPEKLEDLAISQENAGLIDASEESRQVWDALVSVLDQMVELLGEETLSSKDYADLLTTTLSDIKVGVLPQSEGKVQLGTITRSQLEEVKALYIAGINDNIIPAKNDPTNILTPKELENAEKLGFTLSKTSDRLSEEEMFSIYKSMSAATEYLFLSYCAFDSAGAELRPSTLISDIRKLYPENEIESDIQNAKDDLAFIEGKTLTLNKLSSVLRESMEKGSLSPVWMASYNLLKDDAEEIKEGLRYTNKQTPLGKEIAQKLFAKPSGFSLSPSKLDSFASCPFKHFVSYGLKPKEEKEFGMNASEIGTIHHEALLKLCDELSLPAKKEGISITDPKSLWMTVTDEKLEEMISEILLKMKDNFHDGVMTSSKESEYTSKRTKATCLKFAKHMVEEVRRSVIDEMYFESRFGRDGLFPAIVIETTAGKVYVEGRIDRVDVCPNADAEEDADKDSKHIRVIDYKSGNTGFKKELVEEGLQLQLMVYLEGALGKYPKGSTGSVYYFHVKDASAAANLEDFPKEKIAQAVLSKIEKEYNLDGMKIDSKFQENFAQKLEELCARLTSGNIDIDPKKYKTIYNSCRYCDYKSICQKEVK